MFIHTACWHFCITWDACWDAPLLSLEEVIFECQSSFFAMTLSLQLSPVVTFDAFQVALVVSLVPTQKKQWVTVKGLDKPRSPSTTPQIQVPRKQQMFLDDRLGGQMGVSVA